MGKALKEILTVEISGSSYVIIVAMAVVAFAIVVALTYFIYMIKDKEEYPAHKENGCCCSKGKKKKDKGKGKGKKAKKRKKENPQCICAEGRYPKERRFEFSLGVFLIKFSMKLVTKSK